MTHDMKKYQLEYSEKQGFFHFADKQTNPNKEYKVICNNLSQNQCEEFTELMFEKFPNINTGQEPTPSFKTIFEEFKSFLLT
jgi:hypothetical protein